MNRSANMLKAKEIVNSVNEERMNAQNSKLKVVEGNRMLAKSIILEQQKLRSEKQLKVEKELQQVKQRKLKMNVEQLLFQIKNQA